MRKPLLRGKAFDLLILLFYPLFAALFSFSFGANALASAFIFFGIPGLYLSFRKPFEVKKALFFSLFSIPLMVLIDYVAHITNVWRVPSTVFPFRIFSVVPIEDIVWVLLHFYVVVMFYEHFLKNHAMERIVYPRTKVFFLIVLGLFVLFLMLLFFQSSLLLIPYWYLVFGFLFLVPPIIFEEIRFPHVFLKIIKAAIYFSYLNFVYEIVALKLGWWSFPGLQHIGWVSFFGTTFPFEELFFWILLFSAALLSYYEYFDDTEK